MQDSLKASIYIFYIDEKEVITNSLSMKKGGESMYIQKYCSIDQVAEYIGLSESKLLRLCEKEECTTLIKRLAGTVYLDISDLLVLLNFYPTNIERSPFR